MKIHPILFSTPMIQSLLNGTKTQTRRLVKPTKKGYNVYWSNDNNCPMEFRDGWGGYELKPKYKVGDFLWVRETLYQNGELNLDRDSLDVSFCIKKRWLVFEARYYLGKAKCYA